MHETGLRSDEILACFEEALGERQPEMGTDAAAGREANAESAEAAPRLEAAAEQQREHSLLAPTAGRGVEPVLPDPVPMPPTNSSGGRRSCEPDAGNLKKTRTDGKKGKETDGVREYPETLRKPTHSPTHKPVKTTG